MKPTDDLELLRKFTREQSQDAFTTLVTRHLNLVYCAGLRQVCAPQLAEEVAQSVFTDLARNAARLKSDTVLTAWLYEVTRRTAINVVRGEARRQLREQIAVEMNTMNGNAPDWTQIEPLLEEAMHALDETDRTAVLLRFFENKSLREVGESLGTTNDTARKRVNRAVERLREFFAKRGVTVGVSGLVATISANAVQAAPVGLAFTISTAAALAGTTLVTSATATAAKTIAMTTLQKTLVFATLVAGVGISIYEARQASQLRRQVQMIQQQQSPMTDELAQLRTENERLSSQLARTRNSQALSQRQFEELLRLRSQSGQAQAQAGEVARLKSAVADHAARADQLTNATAMGMEMAQRAQMIRADAKLAVMKATLNLNEDQERAIREVLKRHTRRRVEIARESMSGKMTPELREAAAAEKRDQESEIKALFTPEQVAAYPQFEQAEKLAAADTTANYQVSEIAKDVGLSQEQQQQVRTAFAQLILKETSQGPNPDVISAAGSSGNLSDALTQELESEKSQLEERLKVLSPLLTSEQLDAYRQAQLKRINMMAGAMKAFVPPPPTERAPSR